MTVTISTGQVKQSQLRIAPGNEPQDIVHQDIVHQDIQTIDDHTTGLKNELVRKQSKDLQYVSTATKLQIEKDQSNLARFEILKDETFKHYQQIMGPLDMLSLIKQLVADVEYIFHKDKKSGFQKQQLVYDAFLQYSFQIENFQYDTLTKSNILKMIDDVYKHNKKDLMYIASALHKGIKLGVKISEVCLLQ